LNPLVNELIAQLLRLAALWSGYDEPPQVPTVLVVAQPQMPCACAGAFRYASRSFAYGGALEHPARLFLREDVNLDGALGRSILLHELVHALQAQHGPARYGTPLWHQREREAYRVQYRYLRATGMAMHGELYLPREE
jgi:hypothetical protein